MAAAHRVGEQVLGEDLRSAEAVASEASAALASRNPLRGASSASAQSEAAIAAERAEMREYMQQQEEVKQGVLRRAGVELRVLVKSLQMLEGEVGGGPSSKASKPPEGRASPPPGASPGPKPRASSPAGSRPPKAPGRGRGRGR